MQLILESLFNGVAIGSVLLIAALGLAIVFGLMGVINLAHGELMMLGAYSTYVTQLVFKLPLLKPFYNSYVIVSLIVAFVVSAIVGILLERSIIRRLYGSPLETLLDLAKKGMPAATELLDPVVPQYIADLISWTAIGARTTESQTHREMASGLSMPVGYKNGTDGTATIAINAMQAASKPHHFLGINHDGHASIVSTTGNPNGHLVLRGGKNGTNYHLDAINLIADELEQFKMPKKVMVDCSHGNSNKDFRRQSEVLRDVASQIKGGSKNLMGVMIESHLVEGNQKLNSDLSKLTYGQSVTDACINFSTTEILLEELAESVK